jgi:hypothetical protein
MGENHDSHAGTYLEALLRGSFIPIRTLTVQFFCTYTNKVAALAARTLIGFFKRYKEDT